MKAKHIGFSGLGSSKHVRKAEGQEGVAYFVKRNSYCTTSWILTDLFLEMNKNNVS